MSRASFLPLLLTTPGTLLSPRAKLLTRHVDYLKLSKDRSTIPRDSIVVIAANYILAYSTSLNFHAAMDYEIASLSVESIRSSSSFGRRRSKSK